jgi:hypothetical protein
MGFCGSGTGHQRGNRGDIDKKGGAAVAFFASYNGLTFVASRPVLERGVAESNLPSERASTGEHHTLSKSQTLTTLRREPISFVNCIVPHEACPPPTKAV